MNQPDIKIFVAFHKLYFFKCENSIFKPIQAGKAISDYDMGILSDDVGPNISKKNPNYCELTVLYWIWKNVEADYIGLTHYRRSFTFYKVPKIFQIINIIFNNRISSFLRFKDFYVKTILSIQTTYIGKKYRFYDEKLIRKALSDYDLILPRKYSLGNKSLTLEEHYKIVHNPNDFDTMIKVILELYPDYQKYIDRLFRKRNLKFYWGNMFIFPYDIFSDYMEWLFSILFEVEKRIEISKDPNESRVFGFLAERLLNLYISKIKETQRLKIKEIGVYFHHLSMDPSDGPLYRFIHKMNPLIEIRNT